MRTNMLKLNSDKTEVMLFTAKHNAIHIENVTVCFGDINITPVNTVRNLGVMFDSALNMEQQLNNICRSGYHQRRNIGHIRRYLTSDASKSLANGLITEPLYYCNALLNEPSHTSIKLQHIQNTAALHEQAPRYISDMLTVYQPRRTLRSIGSVTLIVPWVRTSS